MMRIDSHQIMPKGGSCHPCDSGTILRAPFLEGEHLARPGQHCVYDIDRPAEQCVSINFYTSISSGLKFIAVMGVNSVYGIGLLIKKDGAYGGTADIKGQHDRIAGIRLRRYHWVICIVSSIDSLGQPGFDGSTGVAVILKCSASWTSATKLYPLRLVPGKLREPSC